MRCPLVFAAAIAVLASLAACEVGQDPHDSLADTVRRFNADLRWSRSADAAAHMEPPAQQPWLDAQDAVDKNIEIDDLLVERVRHAPSLETARAVVTISWDRKNEGLLHTSRVRETWHHEGNFWMLTHMEQVSGDPLPILANAGPVVEGPDDAPASAPAGSPAPGTAARSPWNR